MSFDRQVVVTGLGAVSPVGNNVEDSWQALLAGRSGIATATRYQLEDQRCQIAGEVKNLELDNYLSPKEAKRLDMFCHFAVVAAQEAIQSAGLPEELDDPFRAGVLVSSGIGGLQTLTDQIVTLSTRGPDRVSPLTIPMMIADMASGYLAIRHHFNGPNFAIVSACASALHSIGEAAWIIQRGDADIMLTGGAEAGVNGISAAAFGRMRALSERNDDPTHASRPFDLDRDGFVPAEGAGILVLEELEHAKKRGANILAKFAGYGLSGDAWHITAPREDGTAAAAAIAMAFRHANLSPDTLAYINAHGTSTPLNDKTETGVIKQALGERAYHVAVGSTKSMTGRMLGAAGGFESVVCVKAIQTGLVPPTINQITPDPDCDLDYIPNQAREMAVPLALNLSFGFGGHNAAVLFQKP
ncbi:MAG: beta-ketoacyl-ACP synthase II [Victivallales bacterium]|nr:beta-ketoacyl-ACP synthase II [Victivallales bacterium]